MPCMGPNINQIVADEAYKEILALLKGKYNLLGYEPTSRMVEFREKALESLKKAVEDVFWQEACESF